jgi:two-component system, cell cycle sensor histidine kinase and response regulator CckA
MYTVLFADDTDAVRTPLCVALRYAGYSVLEAGDGYEGLLLSRLYKGPIHLLIADVVMPRMGGMGLSRALKAHHPETNVLFISGYPADMLEQNAAFLQKPFTPVTLISRVAEILSANKAGLRIQGAGPGSSH